jgi:hypothetical protein
MSATSLDVSQIKTDALSAASTFRTLIGLGFGDTPTFLGLTLGTSGVLVGGTNLIEQRNSTNAQRFNLYNTFSDSSNYERGKLEWASNVLRIGTEKAGTGSARALELQTDGTTRMSISAAGAVTIGAVTLPATDGTSGQVLATNGSGVATWQTRATRAFAVAMAVAL